MNAAVNKSLLLRIYFLLAFIEGLASLASLILIPSDPRSAAFLSFSASRLVLMGFVLIACLICGGMFLWLSVSFSAHPGIIGIVDRFLKDNAGQRALQAAALLIFVGGVSLLLLPAQRWGDAVDQFQRLVPLLAWMAAIALQTLVAQFLWLGGIINWRNLAGWGYSLQVALITAGVLAVVSVLILWSRIGIAPDRSGWYKPGTPLLITQVFFAWIIGAAFIFWGSRLERWLASLSPGLKLDLLLCIALWLAATLIWGMEPLKKTSYFMQEPTPPNFAYYPYSDARLYDESAQSILVGAGRDFRLILRPLYAFFLALLHAAAGQRFEQLILIQVGILAAIPVLVFGLASQLSNRPAAMIAALLAILREKNSIALTNVIEVSHSKLILSDVPAMALVLLFLFLLVKWLRGANQKSYLGISAGASLGLIILIRSQAQLLIPVVLIGMLFVLRFQWRKFLQGSLVFLLGVLAVIGPWIWRNYQASGRLVVESTEHYIGFFASSYLDKGQTIEQLPGESFDDYYNRMERQIRDYMIRHPGEVAGFYASHFIHNEIESMIYLPMSIRLYDLRSYVQDMTFWKTLQIDLTTDSAILFFLSLVLLALGIGVAVNRLGLLGLAPLLIHLGYSLTVVPARLSGWRFILPVDWVTMLYYSIGLIQVTLMAWAILSKSRQSMAGKRGAGLKSEQRSVDPDARSTDLQKNDRRKVIPVLAGFLILGLALPLSARYMPLRYNDAPDEIIQKYAPVTLNDGGTLSVADLQTFVQQEGRAVLTEGRALYPSFYEQGKYWGDNNPYNLDIRDYTRVQFNLVGPYHIGAFLPVAAAPEVFPHASDVVVVGCMSESGNSLRALVVIVNQKIILNASPWNGLSCAETQ